MSTLKGLEERLRGLLKGPHTSLGLDFNEAHTMNYMTAKEWDEEGHYGEYDWVSPQERVKALETNSVWTLQWYPQTQVGFYLKRASSLNTLLEYVMTREFD